MIDLVTKEEIKTERRRLRTKKYSRNKKIEILQKWTNDNNRIPTEKDFSNNPNLPYYTSYVNEFGTWNNALIAAGIGIRPREKKYSRNQLIEVLQQWEKDNNTIPTEKDFSNNPDIPSFMTYVNEFCSWSAALIAAGFKPNDETTRSRQGELQTISEFKIEGAVDLSGKNRKSTCDGKCPKGELFDTKSASLTNISGSLGWYFRVTISQLEEAGYLFLRAYKDIDFTKIPEYKWRIPIEFMDNKTWIIIYKDKVGRHNILNMKKYEID